MTAGATTMIGGTAIAVGGWTGLSLAQSYHDFHGFGGGMGGMGLMSWVGALLGFLFALALLLLIAALVWRLVRSDRGAGSGTGGGSAGVDSRSTSESPLEVLEQRYARGEVDREEFLQKRDDLTGG